MKPFVLSIFPGDSESFSRFKDSGASFVFFRKTALILGSIDKLYCLNIFKMDFFFDYGMDCGSRCHFGKIISEYIRKN